MKPNPSWMHLDKNPTALRSYTSTAKDKAAKQRATASTTWKIHAWKWMRHFQLEGWRNWSPRRKCQLRCSQHRQCLRREWKTRCLGEGGHCGETAFSDEHVRVRRHSPNEEQMATRQSHATEGVASILAIFAQKRMRTCFSHTNTCMQINAHLILLIVKPGG